MALDPYRRIRTGDKLPGLPSDPWNRMLGTIKQSQSNGLPRADVGSPVEILIKNTTAVALPRFSVLGFEDPTFTHGKDTYQFLTQNMMNGTLPTASGAFAITEEAISVDAIGRARIVGLARVRVNLTNIAHEYANPTTATTGLTSSTNGPARILWLESDESTRAVGVQWAVVILGDRTSRRETAAITITSSTPIAGRYQAVRREQTGLASDWPVAEGVYVYNTQSTSLFAGLTLANARYNTDQYNGRDQLAVDYCCTSGGDPPDGCAEICDSWVTQWCVTITIDEWDSADCISSTGLKFILTGGAVGDPQCASWSGVGYVTVSGEIPFCMYVYATLDYTAGQGFFLSIRSFGENAACQFAYAGLAHNPPVPFDCEDISFSVAASLGSPTYLTCPGAGKSITISLASDYESCVYVPESGSGDDSIPCVDVGCSPEKIPVAFPVTFALLSGACAGNGQEVDLAFNTFTGSDWYWSATSTLDGVAFELTMRCSNGITDVTGFIVGDGITQTDSTFSETSPGVWTLVVDFTLNGCEFQAAGSFDVADCPAGGAGGGPGEEEEEEPPPPPPPPPP